MKASTIIFAAICVGIILVSCTSKEGVEATNIPSQEKVVPAQMGVVSIEATKGIDTKALALDGTKLAATWEHGETVAVYNKSSMVKLGAIAPVNTGVSHTRLEGTVNIAGLAVDDELLLVYPELDYDTKPYRKWTYDGQDGTLETVSQNYDYATATVKVKSVTIDHLSAEFAAFKNQQAIVHFNLKNKATGDDLSTSNFYILSKDKKLVREHDYYLAPIPSYNFCYQNTEKNELTLAIASMDDEADDYYFLATSDDANNETYFELLKKGVHFDHGKYYDGNLKLEEVQYVAAGSPSSIFGETWAVTKKENALHLMGNSFFKAFTVPDPCEIVFKVVRNGKTYYPFPDGGEDTNIKINALAGGKLRISYYPFTQEVEYDISYNSNPGTIYTIAGNSDDEGDSPDTVFGTEWDRFNVANDMSQYDDKYIKKYTGVTAGTKLWFKVVQNRDWATAWGDGAYNYYYEVLSDGDVTIVFDPTTHEITVNKPDVVDEYTVVGEPAEILGSTWDVTDTDNNMVWQSDGKYHMSYHVSDATDFQFKVVKNHAYSNGEWPSSNYVVSVPGSGTLYIEFDPEAESGNGKVTAWAEADVFTLVGSFNDWNVNDDGMVKLEDGRYYEGLYLSAGLWEFKVVGNHSWSWDCGDPDNFNNNYTYNLATDDKVYCYFDPRTGRLNISN